MNHYHPSHDHRTQPDPGREAGKPYSENASGEPHSVSSPVSEPLVIARELVAAGISVIPWQNYAKEPAHDRLPSVWNAAEGRAKRTWSEFRQHLPSEDHLQRWFSDGRCGIAIVCGAVSNGLMVLDFEAVDAFEQWRAHALSLLDASLVDALPICYRTENMFHTPAGSESSRLGI